MTEPLVPPTPTGTTTPVIGEPGLLRVVVVIQWIITISYFLGFTLFFGLFFMDFLAFPTGWWADQNTFFILIAAICHGTVAGLYLRNTIGLRRRQYRAWRFFPWLFTAVVIGEIGIPYALYIDCHFTDSFFNLYLSYWIGNFSFNFPILDLVVVSVIAFLIKLVLSIFSIVLLRRPSVRALFEETP